MDDSQSAYSSKTGIANAYSKTGLLKQTAHFNATELDRLRKQFKRISARDDHMDQDSFRTSMGVLGMVQDSILCQRLFSVFNASKSGRISFDEYAHGLGVLMKGSVDEKLDFAFAMTDIDGSGSISFDELLLTVQSIMRMYAGMMGEANSVGGRFVQDEQTLDVEAVRVMFDRLDRDNDGTVSLEEYKRGMKKHPEFVASLRGASSDMFDSSSARMKKQQQLIQTVCVKMINDVDRALVLVKKLRIEDDETITDDELAIEDDDDDPTAEIFRLLNRVKDGLQLVKDGRPDRKEIQRKGLTRMHSSRPAQEPLKKRMAVDAPSHVRNSSSHSTWSLFGNAKPPIKDDESEQLADFLSPAASGSTVFFGHRNWDLVMNVMKGIQLAVGRSAAEAHRAISPFDFHVKEKYTLMTSNVKSSSFFSSKKASFHETDKMVRFVDYAPLAFSKLRRGFGIDDDAYVHSIGPGNMLSNLMLGSLSSLAELGTEGKSGSFFYFTSDGLFMVKTVRKEEHKLFRRILPNYYAHMLSTSEETSLLTRIVGLHVVRTTKNSKIGAKKIYFVVMTNMIKSDLKLHRRFDLKGSWVGRRSREVDRTKESSKTLKDLDFKEMKESIDVDEQTRLKIMRSLRYDCSFLEQHGLIDYSLLIGIHDGGVDGASGVDSSPTGDDDLHLPYFQRHNGGVVCASDPNTVYVMGVIDFLTKYGRRKRCERGLKTVGLCQDPHGMSVAPASVYARRFLKFMDNEVFKK